MTLLNEVIIIGGGKSIREGISFNLNNKIQNKCTIACNYAFRHFPHTILSFVDKNFYVPSFAKNNQNDNPDIYEELKNEPLIVGINHNGISEFKLDNTFLFKHQSFLKEIKSPREGFYTRNFLTGVFSLSLACYLLDYSGTIYLMGFDWNKEGDSHYYSKEEINHRGQGFLNCYRNHKSESVFNPFLQFSNVKIYNVSPESGINSFEKIDYETMIKKINNEKYFQEELRDLIRRKLCTE